jgi:hypothetical protein
MYRCLRNCGPLKMSREMAHKVIVPKKNYVPKFLKQWYIGNFMNPSAVVVCCCVLEGRGGLLVAVLCEQVGAGWQASPSPTHYSVGIHGCMLVCGGVL